MTLTRLVGTIAALMLLGTAGTAQAAVKAPHAPKHATPPKVMKRALAKPRASASMYQESPIWTTHIWLDDRVAADSRCTYSEDAGMFGGNPQTLTFFAQPPFIKTTRSGDQLVAIKYGVQRKSDNRTGWDDWYYAVIRANGSYATFRNPDGTTYEAWNSRTGTTISRMTMVWNLAKSVYGGDAYRPTVSVAWYQSNPNGMYTLSDSRWYYMPLAQQYTFCNFD